MRAVIVPYVLSRAFVVVALGISRLVVDELAVVPRPLAVDQGLLAWDAAWYADIARGGYDAVAAEGLRFFPLVPLLARAVAWFPGVDTNLALLLVANLSAFGLGFVLYRLAWFERHDDAFARRAVWLVYLAPPAFVLVMGYSEATFMLLAAVVLLALRQQRWWVAAFAGLLAGGCRPIGLLLAVPALVEAVQQRRALTGRDIAARVTAVVAPVLGCFAYLTWAVDRTDDFFAPFRIHEDPTRRGSVKFPVTNVVDTAQSFLDGGHNTAGMHLVTVALLAALLVVLGRRWPASYTCYAGAALLLSLTASNLDSLERYALSTLPFVLAIADVADTEARERVVLVAAAAGLVGASVLAFTGVIVP
ncbi:MAG: mannosyltransferase family protein [Acidimicrobiia bacterium]